ncbi:hypothetical protein K435DRAFT_858516 [Dendrothele bispora CBS 962.96]|uniref:Uncharacterized protein n=1 Tax=Dendrothele bispora (strain CBS 962.96) TaxID=1314807 RepID=A0A4S8M2Z4_DENBC|nr:hypothetical protein K435DRAFT_858516 [Dendrothele bispora CBS 962.96]
MTLLRDDQCKNRSIKVTQFLRIPQSVVPTTLALDLVLPIFEPLFMSGPTKVTNIERCNSSMEQICFSRTPNEPLKPICITAVAVPKSGSGGGFLTLTLAKAELFAHPKLEITVSSPTNYDGIFKLYNKLTETLKLSRTLDFTLLVIGLLFGIRRHTPERHNMFIALSDLPR